MGDSENAASSLIAMKWNCQVSEAIARDEHREVSEQIMMLGLGQSHFLLWMAKDLSCVRVFNFS